MLVLRSLDVGSRGSVVEDVSGTELMGCEGTEGVEVQNRQWQEVKGEK